jgi:hypothetical protein
MLASAATGCVPGRATQTPAYTFGMPSHGLSLSCASALLRSRRSPACGCSQLHSFRKASSHSVLRDEREKRLLDILVHCVIQCAKPNNMQNHTFQSYLNDYIKSTSNAFDRWVLDQKKQYQATLNEFLEKKIDDAHKSLKEEQEWHIDNFNRNMNDLEQMKKQCDNPNFANRFKLYEESNKNRFESAMRFVEKNWKSYIEGLLARVTS